MDASDALTARVRAALGEQNIKLAELSRRLHTNEMWVARRVNGQTPISVIDLLRIADAINVRAADLLPDYERASA